MEISLVTFNLSASFLSPPGVPAWNERKSLCLQAMYEAQAGIIGLQEVMVDQFDYFNSHLHEFGTVAVTDTTINDMLLVQALQKQYGIQTIPSPWEVVLFYRRGEFDQLDWGHWWLSPTPDKPSVGFGNIAPRVVVWVHLKHRALNQQLIVFNTHIDQRCTLTMIRFCIERTAEFSESELPIFFLGDFNITSTDIGYSLLISNGWQDSCTSEPDAHHATFMDGRRIDYIFYRGRGVKPQRWTQLYSPDSERRLSDHDPVYASFVISS
jgi:endonuclease/exonuclease/phosphatase family metal-dependent hydrolase